MEGGGATANQKAELRIGFDGLLRKWKSKASAKRLSFRVVCTGSRDQAYGAFINALRTEPERISALLIDSETHVAPYAGNIAQDSAIRVAHVTDRDGWDLREVNAERVHLMAQCMETWIVADPEALQRFYGNNFVRNALPTRQNLEDEPKQDVYEKLARASRHSQKGTYAKIRHASQLLQAIRPEQVVTHCARFSVLTAWLDATIGR